jgi:hypothetical protein
MVSAACGVPQVERRLIGGFARRLMYSRHHHYYCHLPPVCLRNPIQRSNLGSAQNHRKLFAVGYESGAKASHAAIKAQRHKIRIGPLDQIARPWPAPRHPSQGDIGTGVASSNASTFSRASWWYISQVTESERTPFG